MGCVFCLWTLKGVCEIVCGGIGVLFYCGVVELNGFIV